MLTIHLETLVPIHPHCQCQVEVTNAAIGEFCGNEPAISAILLDEPGLDAYDLATQKAGRIDEVTAMRQQLISEFLSFRIACWSPGVSAGNDKRLKVICLDVAISRIAVPRFEREDLPYLLLDELMGEGDARIKAFHRS